MKRLINIFIIIAIIENEWDREVDYIKMKNLRAHKNNYFPAIGRLMFIEVCGSELASEFLN